MFINMKRCLVLFIMTEVQLIKCDMSLLERQKEHLRTYNVGKRVEKHAHTWIEGVLMGAVSLAVSLKIKMYVIFDLPISRNLSNRIYKNKDVFTEIFIIAIFAVKM